MESLVAGNTKFSLDLFKNITEKKKTDNIFYSPLSISSALAMVYMGARGNTATEMAESLHLHKAAKDVHASFNFEENYIQDTKKFYEAELETVDFISNAKVARVNMNSWVEKQTQEKIKDLLTEGAVGNMTRLVLVNAIYFKGDWDKKFKGSKTKQRQFKLNKNESKPVQMMRQTDTFGLAIIPEVRCQILEMPYKGKELSMLILLPQEIEDDSTGLLRLERELTYEKLIEWTQPNVMKNIETKVALPKFKMEETYDLKDILVGLGMKDAFDVSRSDFSGMSPSNGLVVSKVVHKSFVEVNEEGTEAAASTAAIMEFRSLSMPPPNSFIANHPFLFFIRHNPTQSILFYGRLCSP
ncbi:hypothetical protein SKAU_G00071170 [Synaphobranchus kaupii]|uniref:Serpin B6 n=1 Tax=Synaphobranchus kaupii TaxID=118154 RepID=A0A9Q1G6T5_SYNKA|nr:hypothetical protein SKAU_G00071170 [Synaphobranchus kaupii]